MYIYIFFFKVYVVDARNHGDSPWTDEMDWVILADDIGDFLTQYNIPKAVLVGHSMGGRASFTFALKRVFLLPFFFVCVCVLPLTLLHL